MKVRNIVLGAAAVALACASVSVVRAADQSTTAGAGSVAPSTDVTMSPVYMQAAPSGPTSLTPFMYLMDGNSFGKWMEANGYSITGFGEGGYFYDTSAPRMGTNAADSDDAPTNISFPGAYSNRGVLDQADILFQKSFVSGKTFDFGFQFEAGYGIDDAYIHSDGLLDNRALPSIANKFNGTSGVVAGPIHGNANALGKDAGEPNPANQFDIIQANGSVLLPIGAGVTVKAGKFVTLLSNEVINPTGNLFYTHSYNFTFGVPLTQTGVLTSYTFAKLINGNDWTFTAGPTRGWNESTNDNNGEVDFLGEASGSITDKLALTFNMSEGPETYQYNVTAETGLAYPGDFRGDSKNYQTVVEAIPSYKLSDQLTLTGDFLYGDLPHGSYANEGSSAQWYGTVLYASYKLNSYLTINGRGEWYRDQGGFTVANGISANYYAGTFGVDIHPLPNDNIFQYLQLRPEVRYDVSDRTVFNASHNSAITGVGDYDQFTVAMDAIMQF